MFLEKIFTRFNFHFSKLIVKTSGEIRHDAIVLKAKNLEIDSTRRVSFLGSDFNSLQFSAINISCIKRIDSECPVS